MNKIIKIILYLCKFLIVKNFVKQLSIEFLKTEKKEVKTIAEKCQEELSLLKGKKAIVYHQPRA